MSKESLIDLCKLAAVIIAGGCVAGAIVLHFAPPTQNVTNSYGAPTPSPVGTTFNSAKTSMIVWQPTSNAATSTSIYNGDATDRIIKQLNMSCRSLAFTASTSLVALNFKAATTAVSSLGLQKNTNYILNIDVSTSTAEQYIGSTTPGLIAGSDLLRRWPAGTYVTFNTNASSTNTETETCIVGVDYFGN